MINKKIGICYVPSDIIDFVLLTIYPVGALFIIEILSRIISRTARPVPSWLKLSIQGITMVGFAVTYTAFMPFLINQDAYTVEPHAITAFCLVALHLQLHCFTRQDAQKSIQKNPFTNYLPNLPSILRNLFFFPVPPSRIILLFSPNLFALS